MNYHVKLGEHKTVKDAFTVEIFEDHDGTLKRIDSRDFKHGPRNDNFQRAINYIDEQLTIDMRSQPVGVLDE